MKILAALLITLTANTCGGPQDVGLAGTIMPGEGEPARDTTFGADRLRGMRVDAESSRIKPVKAPRPATSFDRFLQATRPPGPCPEDRHCHDDDWEAKQPTLAGLVGEYFDRADHPWAYRVVFCESSGKPTDRFSEAKHPGSGATGWFQHLPKFWGERSDAAGFDGWPINHPRANVAVAAWLFYDGGGSRHWAPSERCWRNR